MVSLELIGKKTTFHVCEYSKEGLLSQNYDKSLGNIMWSTFNKKT